MRARSLVVKILLIVAVFSLGLFFMLAHYHFGPTYGILPIWYTRRWANGRSGASDAGLTGGFLIVLALGFLGSILDARRNQRSP